jgi:hypothetical protein
MSRDVAAHDLKGQLEKLPLKIGRRPETQTLKRVIPNNLVTITSATAFLYSARDLLLVAPYVAPEGKSPSSGRLL